MCPSLSNCTKMMFALFSQKTLQIRERTRRFVKLVSSTLEVFNRHGASKELFFGLSITTMWSHNRLNNFSPWSVMFWPFMFVPWHPRIVLFRLSYVWINYKGVIYFNEFGWRRLTGSYLWLVMYVPGRLVMYVNVYKRYHLERHNAKNYLTVLMLVTNGFLKKTNCLVNTISAL